MQHFIKNLLKIRSDNDGEYVSAIEVKTISPSGISLEKLHKKSSNPKGPNKIKSNGEIIEDPLNIANEFNNFFCSIGTNLAEKINTPPYAELKQNIPNNDRSIFLYPTTSEEIINTIYSLKNKAGGADGISTTIIKKIAFVIAKPLEHIINLCLKTGE